MNSTGPTGGGDPIYDRVTLQMETHTNAYAKQLVELNELVTFQTKHPNAGFTVQIWNLSNDVVNAAKSKNFAPALLSHKSLLLHNLYSRGGAITMINGAEA